jgi:hypothetical protein
VTWLPIVERELCVAARKRSTFWVRIIAALVALIIAVGFLLLTAVGSLGFGVTSLGKGLFAALTWLSLTACLSAGLFFTSDCLSEEKREGTIGFLFLTDLSGLDIVLGKLLATSLRGFYALLAILPILAITVLMGGVTGAQFWKTALALVNALFLSLAAGLFVSALSRDSQKALAATLLLLVVINGGGPAVDALSAAWQQRGFQPSLSLSSPIVLFLNAQAWGRTPFWSGLVVNQAVAGLLLGLACILLPRTWQEKNEKTSRKTWRHAWKFGGPKRRAALRRKLISRNPVQWLAVREGGLAAVTLWLASLIMAGIAIAIWASDGFSTVWILWSYFGAALTLVLYLGIASQGTRFFVEAKRSGLLELMLATPLTAKQIVQGHWRALLRLFGPPLAFYLAVQFAGTVVVQQATWSRMAAAGRRPPAAATTTPNAKNVPMTNTMVSTTVSGPVTFSVSGASAPRALAAWGVALAGTLATAANLAALIWFGMWMGMNSKSANLATLKTIVFVQLIPSFVISFAAGLSLPLLLWSSGRGFMGGSNFTVWYPVVLSVVTTTLALGKDAGFIGWARKKLYSEFRERAGQASGPERIAVPPPLPRLSQST